MDVNLTAISKILKEHGYRVASKIGKGSQGNCYVIFSERYQSNFVCKCIFKKNDIGGKARKQFESEVYSLSHIIHKNIVQIYDYFSGGEYFFMVIEYCPNGNLMTILHQKQKLVHCANQFNYFYVRKIFSEILSALDYLHNEQHISHHDIKPSNILIDSFGRAKLCDFGISHYILSEDNEDENFCASNWNQSSWEIDHESGRQNTSGSLFFMSPQLLQCSLLKNKIYDMYAADIWAFGVTAYYLLTGFFPFIGSSKRSLLTHQINQLNQNRKEYSSLFSRLPSDIPRDIRLIITKSLVFDEDKRGTAQELLSILREELAKHSSATSSYTRQIPIQSSARSIPAMLLSGPVYSVPKMKESKRIINVRSKILANPHQNAKNEVMILKPVVLSQGLL